MTPYAVNVRQGLFPVTRYSSPVSSIQAVERKQRERRLLYNLCGLPLVPRLGTIHSKRPIGGFVFNICSATHEGAAC